MLGVFWKIQDIYYSLGTEIFKIEEEITENPKISNPPFKNRWNSLWMWIMDSLNIFTTLQYIRVLAKHIRTRIQNYLPSTFQQHTEARSKKCTLGAVDIFSKGVANFRPHFLSHFLFNFENLSAHLVANILNIPKHPLLLHFG